MKFHEKLQMIRKDKGMSQELLAEKLGISRQAVAKWELAQTYPDIDNLIAISDLFKVSIDRLLKPDEDTCCYSLDTTCYNGDFTQEVTEFLIKAKKVTYAGKGFETESSRPQSHDLQYSEGEYLYIDTYLGGEKFAGEEALWINAVPVWSMNYCGRVLAEEFSGDFLKEALLQVPKGYPYRGPLLYRNGEYTYHCIVNGKPDWFQGYEEIYYNDIKVMECYFHGGTIK